ncbi:MAG TPA: response regulator transcription factor, partial [bacterium]|nr:response regulator transcription factor [bacterium]
MSFLKAKPGAKPRPKKRKIFLLDEQPIVLRGLHDLAKSVADLQICGEAEEPSEALGAIRRLKPDLVILDLQFHGGSAFPLIRDIRSQHPQLPILVFTSERDIFFAQRALEAGAEGYALKQERLTSLLEAIHSLLRGRIYISPRLVEDPSLGLVSTGEKKRLRALPKMSDRELQIFQLLGQGLNTREIAAKLDLSVKTVETYRARLKTKLRLRDANELLRSATFWSSGHRGAELVAAS